MPTRRTTGYFWNNVVVTANAYSTVARTGWGYDNFTIWLQTSGETTLTLVTANDLDSTKDEPYYETTTSLFLPTFYLHDELKWTFTQAGSYNVIIPDFAPLYTRLKNSTNGVTITASWLALGD